MSTAGGSQECGTWRGLVLKSHTFRHQDTDPLLRMLRCSKIIKVNYDSVAGLQKREIVTNRDTVTLIRFFIDFEKYLDICGFNK